MAGRTRKEAVENFLDPLRRAISRVTRDQLVVSPGGYGARQGVHVVTLTSAGFAVLRAPRPVALSVDIQYEVIQAEGELGPWKTTIVQYQYSFRSPDGQNEILGFHWHPRTGRFTHPHVHVGSAALSDGSLLTRKMHIPTGRIAVEQVLRFAIEDFEVEPLDEDWDEVLRAGQQRFERWRTWP